MTDPPQSTMAPPEAAALSRAQTNASTPSQSMLNIPVQQSAETRAYEFTLRAFFPTPSEPTKFNPMTTMTQLLRTMLKGEPSLVLCSPDNDQQLILATTSLPTSKAAFQKFFTVSTTRIVTKNQSNVCIGCTLLSDRTLSSIKFKSPNTNLLAWLKQARVFVESDSLGTERPATIGYLTKIATDITHLLNLRDHLANQLMLVEIDAATAVSLAPHLKQTQIEAMSNGDEFVTILPNFELYRTRISHGSDPNKITTDVVGIKCESKDTKLLAEFFTRYAAETNNDTRDGAFLPRGAINLLGPATYAQILKNNNLFLNQVATVPVNLEYNAWFAIIDTNATSDDAPISLHEHLMRQPWFLRIESVTRNKCLLVTTKPNLPEARAWIDTNLEPMVRKSIPPGIDAPSSLLPRRLDKPVFTEAGQTYAEILKKQFSLAPDSSTTTTTNMRPPRKRQATIIDYDSDQSVEAASPATNGNHSKHNDCNLKPTLTTNTAIDFAKELMSLKTEIESLKQTIATAVEQISSAIKSFTVAPCVSDTNAMDTENETSKAEAHHQSTQPDLSALIIDLKYEIANIVTETRAMFEQQSIKMKTNHLPSKT